MVYIRSWCRVVVAPQQQAGTGLYSNRAILVIFTAAFAVVPVGVTEVGIGVALRIACMPSVLGDLLGLVVRWGQVIKSAAGVGDGWL